MTDLDRVMYVDDDDDIREVGEMALAVVGGFDVRLCSSGEEALAAARDFRPQLVLLDVMMPGMDGPATLAALKAASDTADVPVVFLTAKVQRDEVAKLLSLGASEVIAKPFDPMTLGDQLRAIHLRCSADH